VVDLVALAVEIADLVVNVPVPAALAVPVERLVKAEPAAKAAAMS
jgi:hypothetical protein